MKSLGTILSRVRVPGGAKDFPLSQLPVQTLLRCPYSPRVQSHASKSGRTLKIPDTGSHTLFAHTEILHTLIGMGSAALAAAAPFPGKATQFPESDNEILK